MAKEIGRDCGDTKPSSRGNDNEIKYSSRCYEDELRTKITSVSPARKWYVVQLDDDEKYVFLARDMTYAYKGPVVFYDVVMTDLRAKAYYIPVERIAHVVEDAEGELIDEAKELISL